MQHVIDLARAIERSTGYGCVAENSIDVIAPPTSSKASDAKNVLQHSVFDAIEQTARELFDGKNGRRANEFCVSAFDMADGFVTRRLGDWMCELHRRGAKISVIVDQYGSASAPKFLERLRHAGVHVHEFRTTVLHGPLAQHAPLLNAEVVSSQQTMDGPRYMTRPSRWATSNQFVWGNHIKALACYYDGQPIDVCVVSGNGLSDDWIANNWDGTGTPRRDDGLIIHGPAARLVNAQVDIVRCTAMSNHAPKHAHDETHERYRSQRSLFDGARLFAERLHPNWPSPELRTFASTVRAQRKQAIESIRSTMHAHRADLDTCTRSDGFIQAVLSHPTADNTATNAYKLFHLALAHAQNRVRIVSPVVSIDNGLLMAMQRCIARGVKIELLTTGPGSDSLMSRLITSKHCRSLAEIGVDIYVTHGEMVHAKSFEIDDTCVIKGSANLCRRSTIEDTELCVVIYDPECIQAIRHINDGYFARAQRETSGPKAFNRGGEVLAQVFDRFG